MKGKERASGVGHWPIGPRSVWMLVLNWVNRIGSPIQLHDEMVLDYDFISVVWMSSELARWKLEQTQYQKAVWMSL